MSEERAYWTHEIATFLSVSDSTLRKWCLELEKQGYTFTKGAKNSRALLVRDRDLLILVKHHLRTDKITIEKAVGQALEEFKTMYSNDTRSSDLTSFSPVRDPFEQELKKLNEKMDKQEEFNQKLLKRIDERDQNLIAVLREIQESKKEIAAANQKQKKWWKFWE